MFDSTIRLMAQLKAHGLLTAVVTVSRNAAEILAVAGVADLFDVKVDGLDVAELDLAGKPDPASLLEATRRLGVDPLRTAIVEDAVAGAQAGRSGGFALVSASNAPAPPPPCAIMVRMSWCPTLPRSCSSAVTHMGGDDNLSLCAARQRRESLG